jgi:hypothetical protein
MSNLKKGLIGMLAFDHTAEYIPEVLRYLSRSINQIPKYQVDIFFSYRAKDRRTQNEIAFNKPSNIKNSYSLEVFYDEQSKYGKFIMPPEIVCQQRNVIREFAINNQYEWLFFLDLGVCLNSDTLKRLLATNKECIGAVYREDPWPHPSVYFLDKNKLPYAMLNPNKLKIKEKAYPCLAIEMGACLIRRSLFYHPFELYRYIPENPSILKSSFNLYGGQYGYCHFLNKKGKTPYFLTNHILENIVPLSSNTGISPINDTDPIYLTDEDTWVLEQVSRL